MIIQALTILFVVLFWNTSVDIIFLNKNIVLPISIVVLIYVASVYFILKVASWLQKFSRKLALSKDRTQEAKNQCYDAMLAYVGGDVQKGQQLWHDSIQFLSSDKLFQLLSLVNAKFYPDGAQETLKQVGNSGMLITKFFQECSHIKVKTEYSKVDLLNLLQQFKLPWIYRELIQYHLQHGNFNGAHDVLKEFFGTGNLTNDEWKIFRSQIFLEEAEQEEDLSRKIRLYKKANRINKKAAVDQLVKYYKQSKDLEKARKVVEEIWPILPSIRIGKMYVELDDSDLIPIHKFQHARALGKLNENHPISHILIATYAVDSELWAIAYEYLNKFKEKYPELALILLAKLESRKSGNSIKIWENIEKACVLIAKKDNLDFDCLV